MRARSLGRASAVVLLASPLVACTPDAPVQGGFMSYEEMRDAYDRTLENFPADLPFPEGVNPHPTLESQIVTDPETTDLFQVGSGEVQAYIYWECVWMTQALEADGDSERLDAAVDMLESALDSKFRRLHYEDPGRMWELEVLGGARKGDLRSMRDFAVGCHVDSR